MPRKYNPRDTPKTVIFTVELFHTPEQTTAIVQRCRIPFLVSTHDLNNRLFKPLMLRHEGLQMADKIMHYLIDPSAERQAALQGTIDLDTVQQWLGNLPPWFWCWVKDDKSQIVTTRQANKQPVIYQALFVSKNGKLTSALGEAIEMPKATSLGFSKQEAA